MMNPLSRINTALNYLFILFMGCILSHCNTKSAEADQTLVNGPWEDVRQTARGTTVNFMMWQGSPAVNAYINTYVVPTLKREYNIDLRIAGGQGPEIVQLLMGEKEAGVRAGQVDMVWINGETFFQLRQIDGLWGPFVEKLPNAQYIDFDNPLIHTDFQQKVAGMECPWSIGQFALVYDTARVASPPTALAELEAFVKTNPGTFTVSNDFSGMTLLKSFLAELSGSPRGLSGRFEEEKYQRLSKQLWDYLNRIKHYFWKEGATFPREHSKMDQLFASGELAITYGFGEGGIEDKVRQGLFPQSTRAYAWKNGTIANSNYLGIPYNAPNKAGAMQVINFLTSPEAQLQKASPEGMDANTVLDVSRLPEKWQTAFRNAPKRQYGPAREELADRAIQEPAPEYMIRLYEDFRTNVIEK